MFYSASFQATEPQLLLFLTYLYFVFLWSPLTSKSMWPPLVLPYLKRANSRFSTTSTDFDQIG